MHVRLCVCLSMTFCPCLSMYELATISRLSTNIGLFCKRALQKRLCPAKETYIVKEPTNRIHPICIYVRTYVCIYVSTYVRIYVCVCMSTHAHMVACMHLCVRVCMHACMLVGMRTCMYACMYARVRELRCSLPNAPCASMHSCMTHPM